MPMWKRVRIGSAVGAKLGFALVILTAFGWEWFDAQPFDLNIWGKPNTRAKTASPVRDHQSRRLLTLVPMQSGHMSKIISL